MPGRSGKIAIYEKLWGIYNMIYENHEKYAKFQQSNRKKTARQLTKGRFGHYNKGKATHADEATGKPHSRGVCWRAYCCGALGRGFCRWRTVRTQILPRSWQGRFLYGSGERLRYHPHRTRPHESIPSSGPASRPISKCICIERFAAVRFCPDRGIFRHCRTKDETLAESTKYRTKNL